VSVTGFWEATRGPPSALWGHFGPTFVYYRYGAAVPPRGPFSSNRTFVLAVVASVSVVASSAQIQYLYCTRCSKMRGRWDFVGVRLFRMSILSPNKGHKLRFSKSL
jgi:hypothetical protein